MIWEWGTPLILETQRYILKSIDPSDFPDDIVKWYADPEVMQHMSDQPNLNRQQLKNLFNGFNNKTSFALLAFDKENEVPIGIFRIFINTPNARAETSVLIGNKDYWGERMVFEARTRIQNFLFSAMKLNKICGYVRARNFPALFNYTRLGFSKEGVTKEQVRARDGSFEDVIVFGLLRSTWQKKRNSEVSAK
ncbi:MAG: GNAT family N-acetyltransferase [Sneathiella sp.]|nr:GNAT family N-acetyltransferase [Sneathiella sp.]